MSDEVVTLREEVATLDALLTDSGAAIHLLEEKVNPARTCWRNETYAY
jgi:hypothetical protein